MNKVYKFFLSSLLAIILLFAAKTLIVGNGQISDSNTLYLYNWGDYIDPDLIDKFEEESGYKVVMETYDSNEAMITKIKQKSTNFDICIPSEYAVEMMRDQGLLEKLDHSKIVGLDNIDERFLDVAYDPGNEYSIPYLWGTFGIVYNTKKYQESDFSSWKNLWDKKFEGEILSFDGARETLGIGLLANNLSLNTTDPKKLVEVRNELIGFMGNVKAILADEIRMYMALEEANVGITFSGDASSAIESNENLSYTIPKEGSNIWFDTMVIPKTSKNQKAAYAFINFMLEPENAAQNADYIWYATPNKKALDLIDPEARNDKTLYPDDDVIDKLEVFKALDKESTILYNDLFLDLKISPQAE
ncbi:ABC transporter substrate-binding protein [Anaerococcus prevotii]|uniref:Putative spermidine/putrescine ABC transporter, periplasmic spermidine/putrescine-binding protein PotD n=1 Tax=Anaerococcus prevotii ACS-065-V-Col13 TaxID=879305 RepID=F0GWW0_9FIRM|nr:spermidine/putrescine ABC transporter substrate-binding protein [Anaerococcus prevotii]EGC81734.1 putative spermidine/putrescine ABC transporter, periplasmic spermidine/putrescine-binding protein PotD [Anaerococcus prevotii ACS-065-V-Col13]